MTDQRDLFDGITYDADRDGARLGRQLAAVYTLMQDGRWRTLAEIADRVDGSQPAVSARLRDLRKPKWGAHEVQREYVANGVWKYRLLVKRSAAA